MNKISIICAKDGMEWGRFLGKEIKTLGKVNQYMVDAKYMDHWKEMNRDIICIILSPFMIESNKDFIQKSCSYLTNPIIVLCGVPQRVVNQTTCCKAWRLCQTLAVTSNEKSAEEFYRAVEKRLLEKMTSSAITLIPDTIVQQANQSCVLMFAVPVFGEVEIFIHGSLRKLSARKKDVQTFVFNIPELAEGTHKLSIFVSHQMIPAKLSITVTSPKPSKCLCDYIFQILDSEDFKPLDTALKTSMENDYSNRLFYQNISKPNPDFPEFPTALHFASKHGMIDVLKHLLDLPGANEALAIKNNNNMNCLDIAKDSKHSSLLVPLLEEHFEEDFYIDMTQNNSYIEMLRDHKRKSDPPEIPESSSDKIKS